MIITLIAFIAFIVGLIIINRDVCDIPIDLDQYMK